MHELSIVYELYRTVTQLAAEAGLSTVPLVSSGLKDIQTNNVKLDKKKEIADKMALLGTSAEDMKKYDELKIKKDEEVKVAVGYLEKALTLEPSNKDI